MVVPEIYKNGKMKQIIWKTHSFLWKVFQSRETRWFIEKILTKYWIYQNKNNKEMRSLKMLANGNDPLY